MQLKLGLTYTVLKNDGTTVTFIFVGGEPPCGEINNDRIPLVQLLRGGVLSYWEVTPPRNN